MSSRYVFPNILTAIIDSIAKIIVRKNSGADIGARHRLNFIEGANVTLTITDDVPDDEIDIIIASIGGGGGTADIKPITVNVPTSKKEFSTVIVDAAVTPASQINIGWGNVLQTDINHPSMDDVLFNVIAGSGDFTLELFAADKADLFGDYKLNYLVG